MLTARDGRSLHNPLFSLSQKLHGPVFKLRREIVDHVFPHIARRFSFPDQPFRGGSQEVSGGALR